MTTGFATANSGHANVEKRRSKRFPVAVAAEIKWHGPDGVRIKGNAQTVEVNAHGGLLGMEIYPNVGDVIELTNRVSSESVEARVIAMRRSSPEAPQGMAVELFVPSETFWGMNFQLMKSTAGLRTLWQSVQSDGIDPRLLRELREVVDYIRRGAWAIEESKQLRLHREGQQGLLPLLVSEQIHCTTRLCNELAVELESHEINFGTHGIAELYRAIDRLRERVEPSAFSVEQNAPEKRRFPRIKPLKGMWVAWDGGGQRFVSNVFDLSTGGVFIPIPELPPVGTVVKIIFEVHGGDVHAPAIVRHTVLGRGMGVEFMAMDDQVQARVQRLLKELVR
jgi:PilZ domain